MLICGWRWGLSLALGILLFLGTGAGPLRADGTRSPFRGDIRQFQEELLSGGAFKFMEDTESLIRSGDFEQAFSRYLILRSHIRGQSLYAGLNALVNHRLHFLKTQMGLAEIPSYRAPSLKYKRRVKKTASTEPPGPDNKGAKGTVKATVSPAAPKTEDQEAAAAKPSEDKPAELILPPAPTVDQTTTKPAQEGKSPQEEAQEEKPKETPPPPPPESIWDKLKRRLKFW